MTPRTLVFRYAAFAIAATVANLAVQRLVLTTGAGPSVFVAAVAVGTLVGLVVKYTLDKRWIFLDASKGIKAHGEQFTLYAVTGLVTTAIFWGTETVAWVVWQTEAMRELGAVLGLAVGYVTKYNLDRRFVFTDDSLQIAS